MWVDRVLLVGKLDLATDPLSIMACKCKPGMPARGDALKLLIILPTNKTPKIK